MRPVKGDKVICLKEESNYPTLIKGKIYTIIGVQKDHTGQYLYRLLSGDLYVNYIEQYVNHYDVDNDLDNDPDAIKEIKNNCYFMRLDEWREEQLENIGI